MTLPCSPQRPTPDGSLEGKGVRRTDFQFGGVNLHSTRRSKPAFTSARARAQQTTSVPRAVHEPSSVPKKYTKKKLTCRISRRAVIWENTSTRFPALWSFFSMLFRCVHPWNNKQNTQAKTQRSSKIGGTTTRTAPKTKTKIPQTKTGVCHSCACCLFKKKKSDAECQLHTETKCAYES